MRFSIYRLLAHTSITCRNDASHTTMLIFLYHIDRASLRERSECSGSRYARSLCLLFLNHSTVQLLGLQLLEQGVIVLCITSCLWYNQRERTILRDHRLSRNRWNIDRRRLAYLCSILVKHSFRLALEVVFLFQIDLAHLPTPLHGSTSC